MMNTNAHLFYNSTPLVGKTPEEKLARLRHIRAQEAQYPGRARGGTGRTGLLSTDSRGWAEMQREQIEATNIERDVRGQEALQAESGFQYGGMAPSIANSPDWWLQGEPDPREINAQTIPRIRKNLDMIPPSMRALYAERFKKKERE